jgi:hypothetical protein
MSERGSFVTEYTYCSACFAEAERLLVDDQKYLCSRTLPSWEPGGKTLPIIAGKIGSMRSGGELDVIMEIAQQLELFLCHPLRIAVLLDNGLSTVIRVPAGKPP